MASSNDYWGVVATVAPDVYESIWNCQDRGARLFYEMFEQDKFYLRLTWKAPAKIKTKKIYVPKKQYQRTFKGITFRIGGSKK